MKVDPSTLKIKNYTKEELAKMTYEERQKPYVCESKFCWAQLMWDKSLMHHETSSVKTVKQWSNIHYQLLVCGKRYKNGPGLKYHYTHYNHDQDGSSSETTEVNPHSMGLPGSPMVEPNTQPSVITSTVAITKESRPGIANPNDYCDFCLGDATKNKKTLMSEELLSCADCGRCGELYCKVSGCRRRLCLFWSIMSYWITCLSFTGHPSCLQFTAKLTAKVKQYRWQCIECKSCTFCGTSDNDVCILIVCYLT
jgi:zinc finger protein ubi-d4